MRFDIHLRSAMRAQIQQLAETMKLGEEQPQLTDCEKAQLSERLSFFNHTTTKESFLVAGAQGSGDFPSVSYGDSFVYTAVAQATIYKSDAISGLREVGPTPESVCHFALFPEDDGARHSSLDNAFSTLAGLSLSEVIEASDYQRLKASNSHRSSSVSMLEHSLIRPQASDAGNLSIQLRSTAELGAVLRLIRGSTKLSYVLIGGTLSLPLVDKPDVSLFYEHLKRLCCVEAREEGIGFFTVSKAHGIPSIEIVEELARHKSEPASDSVAEHWYLRLPVPGIDSWETPLTQTRRLPPPGAVSYLIRFHRTTPSMRLDMDRGFWCDNVRGLTKEDTRANEQRIFGNLDYLAHDQRCYGYPYPLRAAHDRAVLTRVDRKALRTQIIEAAVRAGMKRSLFREVSESAGY